MDQYRPRFSPLINTTPFSQPCGPKDKVAASQCTHEVILFQKCTKNTLCFSCDLLAASQKCHWDTRTQTSSPWKIQGSWDSQEEISMVPDKDWNKAWNSNILLEQNESDMQRVRFNKAYEPINKAYEPINKAGFHIQTVYCKIPQGNIV